MNTNYRLNTLGFTEKLKKEALNYPDFYPGRVIEQNRNQYIVATQSGEAKAEVSGKYRFEALESLDFPVVGDFVLLDRETDSTGRAKFSAVCYATQPLFVKQLERRMNANLWRLI